MLNYSLEASGKHVFLQYRYYYVEIECARKDKKKLHLHDALKENSRIVDKSSYNRCKSLFINT